MTFGVVIGRSFLHDGKHELFLALIVDIQTAAKSMALHGFQEEGPVFGACMGKIGACEPARAARSARFFLLEDLLGWPGWSV